MDMQNIILLVILGAFMLFINAITEYKKDYVSTYPINIKKMVLSVLIIVIGIIALVSQNRLHT